MSVIAARIWELQVFSAHRALGEKILDIEKPHPDDTRFADPDWNESASLDIAKEWYLAMTHLTQDMLFKSPGLNSQDRRRAAFWWRKWLNAMAPTNFFWTNPIAIRKALETNGDSVIRGMHNFAEDLRAGTVRMTNPDDFQVGKNLATTPGKVVFRNRLLEVIHYQPTRTAVYKTPIVIVTPWINKFYVLDLNPKKSMVAYLLDQGFDVYITSWKNPDASLRDVGFDAYLSEGVAEIVRVACSISGAEKVHAVGYCIGGAALTTYAAWANRHYGQTKAPLASITLFATMVDYRNPGDIEVFIDENACRWLENSMKERGFLDGDQMASSFRLLRSNSLIWHYVVHGYLYGESPAPFDVLYWNMDTTRMPAAMHSWYLREFYLNNNLVRKDALTLNGEKIDLEQISQPAYVVAAVDDHIAPWRQAFKANNHFTGSKRFVLSSSGHILGIVNPDVKPPKRDYHVADAERHDSADGWHERSSHIEGSWWPDWVDWLRKWSGKAGTPAAVATRQFPAQDDAPGKYVLEH
jgi:polyhydroxyalkanoate synthase